jgi:predicted ATPase
MLADAERALARALEVAHARQARMSDLRAATDLSRLWAEAGRRAEAYDLLAPLHAWFDEGLDSPDLKRAEGLLDVLEGPLAPSAARPRQDQI